MSISEFFERLGAPLRNVQWSWGAERADGVVFLRVWQDETRSIEKRRFIRLVNHRAYEADRTNLGYAERLRHLDAVKQGSPAYVVICRAEDVEARPRSIASFGRELVRLGSLTLIEGDEWGELKERVHLRQLLPSASA